MQNIFQLMIFIVSCERELYLSIATWASRFFPFLTSTTNFEDLDLNRVDLLHFFNGVSYGRTPWVSSFETILPRFSHLVTRHHGRKSRMSAQTPSPGAVWKRLAGGSCLAILPLSQSAALMQADLLKDAQEYAQPILDKMRVLHPPQEVLIPEVSAREYSPANPSRFILVGTAFFGKGGHGREVLEVFERQLVRQEKLPVRLIIVELLRIEPYAAKEPKRPDVAGRKPKSRKTRTGLNTILRCPTRTPWR